MMLKWNIMTEKKTLMTHCVAFLVAFLLIQVVNILLPNFFRTPTPTCVMVTMTLCLSAVYLFNIYYASGILGNADTKEKRTMMLMLPAENSEKYLARIVYVIVIIPLCIAAAFVIATLLRILLQVVLGHDVIVTGFSTMFNESDNTVIESLIGYVYMLSLFVLGGTLFRKHPFIWTWVSIISFAIILGIIISGIIWMTNGGRVHVTSFETNNWIVDVVFCILTVFNCWMSYRLFCRLQTTQHKWFNV